MATSDKPKKIKFEFDPWKECRGKNADARKWAEGKVNTIKPIKFDLTPSKALNERKWPEKKVQEESYYGAPKMGMIMFVEEVAQIRDDKKISDKDKPKELKKLYEDLCGNIEDAVEKWLEEVASGKADNAKGLKEGKAAMEKIGKVDFKGAFGKPCKACVEALKKCQKGTEVDAKELKKAKGTLETTKSEMDKNAKDAQDAISVMLKAARNATKDKDADKSLQEFGAEVMKHEKDFEGFLEGAEEFDSALDEAIEATGGELSPDKLKELLKTFDGLSSLEDKAQKCLDLAKTLAPKFKKIADKLK
jgi:hypothetical protein